MREKLCLKIKLNKSGKPKNANTAQEGMEMLKPRNRPAKPAFKYSRERSNTNRMWPVSHKLPLIFITRLLSDIAHLKMRNLEAISPTMYPPDSIHDF